MNVVRHDPEDGSHTYTVDGTPVPSVSAILAHGTEPYRNEAMVAAAERGTRLHAMILRALHGLEVAPPPAEDEIGVAAWDRFGVWREWWADTASRGAPLLHAWLEHTVCGKDSFGNPAWAGTVDAIGMVPGIGPVVVDWKPRYQTRYKHQLTAYCIAAEQMGLGRDLVPVIVTIPAPPDRAKLRILPRVDDEWMRMVDRYHYDNGEI